VDKIFEHTGGENFPLLVSALSPGETLAFFGATGKGLKGEYKGDVLPRRRRFVWTRAGVWMRQKQVLFRRAKPAAIFDELGLPPEGGCSSGERTAPRGNSWRPPGCATAEVVCDRLRDAEKARNRDLSRMGVPPTRILDRDGFSSPKICRR